MWYGIWVGLQVVLNTMYVVIVTMWDGMGMLCNGMSYGVIWFGIW